MAGTPGLASLPFLNPFRRPFALDMRTGKSRSDPSPGMPRFLRPTLGSGRFEFMKALFRNTVQFFRLEFGRRRWARAYLTTGSASAILAPAKQ